MSALALFDRLQSAIGALIGLVVVGVVGNVAVGSGDDLPLLIAPLGAAAVLLFAVPQSPLARPWPVVGGNVISAFIGVGCAKLIPDVTLGAAAACSLAIAAMTLANCLHPPGGAVALTAVLGGPVIKSLGFGFVLWPVGVSAVLLLTCAMLLGRARRLLPSVAS